MNIAHAFSTNVGKSGECLIRVPDKKRKKWRNDGLCDAIHAVLDKMCSDGKVANGSASMRCHKSMRFTGATRMVLLNNMSFTSLLAILKNTLLSIPVPDKMNSFPCAGFTEQLSSRQVFNLYHPNPTLISSKHPVTHCVYVMYVLRDNSAGRGTPIAVNISSSECTTNSRSDFGKVSLRDTHTL